MKELEIKDIGFGVSMSGMIMSSIDGLYIVGFPGEHNIDKLESKILIPTEEEFEAIINQMDNHEFELFDSSKNAKIIVRKSQRNMDQNIVWQIFRRDNFTCRYCGENNLPMTYDHVMLWEKGGATTLMNGVTSCKKCNKTRGNLEYDEWINTEYYKEVSKNIPDTVKEQNRILGVIYKKFKPRVSTRNR